MVASDAALAGLLESRIAERTSHSLLGDLVRDGFVLVDCKHTRSHLGVLKAYLEWLGGAGDKAAYARNPGVLGGGGASGGCGLVELPGKQVFHFMVHHNMAHEVPQALLAPLAQATEKMHAQAAALLQRLGRALGAAPHGLVALTDELPLPRDRTAASVLHACHYPGASAAASGAGRAPEAGRADGTSAGGRGAAASGSGGSALSGSEAHQDRGLLTLVVADTEEGLEVQSPSTGAWQRVKLERGYAVLLPGLSLERATAGAVRAAMHRVAPAPPGGRASLCYKLRVRPDARIDAAELLGRAPMTLPLRYRAALTGAQLMAELADSHPASVNSAQPGAPAAPPPQPAGQLPPPEGLPQPTGRPQHGAVKREREEPSDGLPAKRERGEQQSSQPVRPWLHLFAKGVCGKTYTFRVERAAPLAAFAAAWQSKVGSDPSQLRFIWQGIRLAMDRTPDSYGMTDNETVHVVGLLRGD